jgi:hypothetical protein
MRTHDTSSAIFTNAGRQLIYSHVTLAVVTWRSLDVHTRWREGVQRCFHKMTRVSEELTTTSKQSICARVTPERQFKIVHLPLLLVRQRWRSRDAFRGCTRSLCSPVTPVMSKHMGGYKLNVHQHPLRRTHTRTHKHDGPTIKYTANDFE